MTALELERVRPLLEAEVQRLIDLLDEMDEDPDLESTADEEPWLGAPEQQAGSWKGIDASFGCDDGEELELGWTEHEARWNRYAGAGDDVYEPSLGSLTTVNQVHWAKGETDDREEACEDEGVIDCDLEDGHDAEPEREFTSNYLGHCSPIETMLGGSLGLAR